MLYKKEEAMASEIDVSCENEILNTNEKVSYIYKKGTKLAVKIDGKKAEFAGKYETIEQLTERARAFIADLMQRYQTAGSP